MVDGSIDVKKVVIVMMFNCIISRYSIVFIIVGKFYKEKNVLL